MKRRTYLTTLAATSATGLAGCSSSSESGDDKAGGQPTKTTSSEMSGGTQLSFGDTLELSQVDLTVDEPKATKQYTWSEEGQTPQQAEAGDGKQWVVVPVRAVNTTNQTVRLPLTLDFKGVVDGEVFHPGRNKSATAKYIGGKVDGGETSEGDMMFLTADSVEMSSFRVYYTEKRTSGTYEAWWE